MAVEKVEGHLLCKKILMLASACGLGVFALHGATCVWTGGSGAWSDSANWLDGAVPSAGDTVYVSNTVANVTIDIDVPGVSIASIRFEGQSAVTLTGNPLTLTGGWSFKAYVPKGTNLMDYRISTFSWLAYGANVECRVPLVFAPSGNSCGVCTATNIVHFREKVTILGSGKTFYLHNGLQPTPEDIAAGAPPSGSVTVPVYFHKEVVGESTTLRPSQAPVGEVHFYDAVRVATLHDAGWHSCFMRLYSPSNSWNEMLVDYGNIIYPQTQGAIPPNTVLRLHGGTSPSSNGIFNLGNFDVTIERIDDSDDGIKQYATATKGGIVNSAQNEVGTYKPYPATLTMKATADGRTTMMVQGKVSVVWDPVGDYTFTFTNRTSATTGFIAVKRGALRLTGNAAFPNVMDVSVDDGATFAIESSASVPVSPNAFLRLGTGAKLGLAAGVSAHVGAVMAGGQLVADGTYSRANANWIEGDGEVVVDGTNIRVWNSASGGAWADSANWAGGRVPDGAEKGVFVYNDSAEDFTVSIASPLASFPTNFNVRNLGGGLTTISCAADVEAARASISVGEGARFKVEDGARFRHATIEPTAYTPISYNNKYSNLPCSIYIHDGGEWLTSGSTVFTNFYGAFIVKGRSDASSAFNMRGGEFLFCDLDSAWPINVYANGALDVRDGSFRLPHHGYNHETDIKLCGGTVSFSNAVLATEGKFPTPNGGSVIFGTGETVFDAGAEFRIVNGNRYLRPNAAGQTARLTLTSGATYVDSYNHIGWFVGGMPGGRAVFDSYAADTVKSRPIYVGNLAGEAELNVKAGLLRIHNVGLHVACNAGGQYQSSETNVTARVVVEAGAAMDVIGSLDSGWEAARTLCGIVVGSGNAALVSGRPFVGSMDVFGSVTNESGNVVIGWGAGKGTYVQHDGVTWLKQDASHGIRPLAVVGLGGGVGRLIVSNGVFDVRHNAMFVGGCPENEIPAFGNTTHVRVPWEPRNVPANNHDAEGTVTVAGGALSVADDVLVGVDGFGTIEMVGNAGTFTAGSLVLSNATSSVVRFVAGAGGFSPIGVTGTLAVTDGTRIEVDLSKYTGNRNVFRLFNFNSFDGDLDNVSLVLLDKDGVSRKVCRLNKTDTAIDFAFVNGTTILFR